MSKHRQAAKVDANQGDIIKTLRKLPGITVAPGHDDLLVGYQDRNFWFEIKNPEVISSKTGQPRPSSIKKSQKNIRATWQGQYDIVWDVNQILDIIGFSHTLWDGADGV